MVSKLCGVFITVLAAASPNCNTFDNCDDCTSHRSWLGDPCRWCPKSDDMSCHAEGSLFNKCSRDVQITDPNFCPMPPPTPAPVPPTPPRVNGELQKMLETLFSALKITDVDAVACAQDETGAYQAFKDFAGDVASSAYALATKDLSRALSAVSNSVSSCNIPEVQQKLDVLAKSVRWANISMDKIDHSVQILVDASDLWQDLQALAAAVQGGDPGDMGSKLAQLLDDWTAISGGCGVDSKTCKLLDGLLRALSVIGLQVDGCEAALTPALDDFTLGAAAFKAKNYSGALQEFATALDVVAIATKQDSCGLKPIGDAISKLGPKFEAAVVQVESSQVVKVLVGSADVYNEMYGIVMDLERDDFAGVGMHLGALLAKLRASGCQTQMCIVLEGLLGSLQIAFTDFEMCSADFQDTWSNMQLFLDAVEQKQWSSALTSLSDVFGDFSSSVQDCGTTQLAQVLEQTATSLQKDGVANIIGKVVQVLVSGADISDDLQKIIVDAQHQNWAALGRDMGALSDWVSGTGCNSFICRILEGVLQQAELALVDFEPCKASLRTAEQEMAQGAALWHQGKNKQGLVAWAAGLNDVAKSVDTCGVAPELAFIQHEAQVLGLGNLSVLNEVSQVIVHGADFYEDLYAAVIAIENKDYRSAGEHLGKVMNQLSEWTTGHLCTSPVCYIVNGVLQYLAALKNDIGACKSDFGSAFGNFTEAYNLIVDKNVNFGGIYGGNLAFTHDQSKIKQAVRDLGFGLTDIANGVQDCHLEEFLQILEALAAKLGIAPEIQIVETMVKILIEGREIELEVADVCSAYATNNWPALGYDLIKLSKTLLSLEEVSGKVLV